MKVGKVSETVLKRSVFKQLTVKRPEVLVGPFIGEDCGVLQLEEDELFVVSSDPITGAVKDVGGLAVQITANDIAASGAEPVGIMLTVLLPDGFSEGELKETMKSVNAACIALNVEVMGGHTEVTTAVNQPVLTVTGIGKIKKEQYFNKKKVEAGFDIVMTKWAGIEGTAILAKEKEEVLTLYFNRDFVERAKGMDVHLSVVPEGRIGAGCGASFMHDVTEGGIFGALWELAACTGKGIRVDIDKIVMKQETIEICEYYELNPYKLISSGSMLIVIDDGQALVKALSEAGIEANIIGKMTDDQGKWVVQEDTIRALESPKSDELYKALAQ